VGRFIWHGTDDVRGLLAQAGRGSAWAAGCRLLRGGASVWVRQPARCFGSAETTGLSLQINRKCFTSAEN